MTEPRTAVPAPPPEGIPPLRDGERLDQKTFHERYEAMPPGTRAELIGGIVHVMSFSLHPWHGDIHGEVMAWLKWYKSHTPGTRVLDNASTILSDDAEPQPDASLLIRPENDGQTRIDADGWLIGAPELVVEVAHSSEVVDLGPKLRDYEQAGVREYVVVLLRRQQVRWFVRHEAGFVELERRPDGFFRSELFGGLWLDPQALLDADTLRVVEVLNQGLSSPEHARFVEQLRRP